MIANNPTHQTYKELLAKLPEIKKFYEAKELVVKEEEFKLLRWIKRNAENYPWVMMMAGCHGEEPAPVIALFEIFEELAKFADSTKVNLVIYPLVNPWGFDRNHRYNRLGQSCNSGWIHGVDKNVVAEEVVSLKKDIKKFRPNIFVSFHEDDETEKEFYIYTFGERKYEKELLDVGKKYFPILGDGSFDNATVRNGVCYDNHDGTAEDMMSHSGVKFSCCSETPSPCDFERRKKCYRDLIKKCVELPRL